MRSPTACFALLTTCKGGANIEVTGQVWGGGGWRQDEDSFVAAVTQRCVTVCLLQRHGTWLSGRAVCGRSGADDGARVAARHGNTKQAGRSGRGGATGHTRLRTHCYAPSADCLSEDDTQSTHGPPRGRVGGAWRRGRKM